MFPAINLLHVLFTESHWWLILKFNRSSVFAIIVDILLKFYMEVILGHSTWTFYRNSIEILSNIYRTSIELLLQLYWHSIETLWRFYWNTIDWNSVGILLKFDVWWLAFCILRSHARSIWMSHLQLWHIRVCQQHPTPSCSKLWALYHKPIVWLWASAHNRNMWLLVFCPQSLSWLWARPTTVVCVCVLMPPYVVILVRAGLLYDIVFVAWHHPLHVNRWL